MAAGSYAMSRQNGYHGTPAGSSEQTIAVREWPEFGPAGFLADHNRWPNPGVLSLRLGQARVIDPLKDLGLWPDRSRAARSPFVAPPSRSRPACQQNRYAGHVRRLSRYPTGATVGQ
jgi:hypothetical protein